MTDIIRVLRVIEYIGTRTEVEKQLAKSIQGDKYIEKTGVMIRTSTVGQFPEILQHSNQKFEVGQLVKCHRYGKGEISFYGDDSNYPIEVLFTDRDLLISYTKDGKRFTNKEEPDTDITIVR